jgi:hypothetical protein
MAIVNSTYELILVSAVDSIPDSAYTVITGEKLLWEFSSNEGFHRHAMLTRACLLLISLWKEVVSDGLWNDRKA